MHVGGNPPLREGAYALPEREEPIVDGGGGSIIIPLPKSVSLVGVSVRPQVEVCPRTTVSLVVRVSAHPTRAVFLGSGVARTQDPGSVIGDVPQGIRFAFNWHGDLALGAEYEYELVGVIYNLTGASKRWIMSAYVRSELP